ncbi:Octanoyltransferase [Candidatus Ecksteinia adelgidicola]|nr:Octanoyltransferase [Candidatus Ecksteinia adelgidicola]
MNTKRIVLRHLGLQYYKKTSQDMHIFTHQRTEQTLDEIWLVQHYPVFTEGKKSKKEDLLIPGNIPVIQSDRGGQITYHGPGQQIMYIMINLKRKKINVRKLITVIENTVINTLLYFNINSYSCPNSPGIYVKQKKICSLGLHFYKGNSSYGLALNVAMDLTPFQYINPCGYVGLKMIQMSMIIPNVNIKKIHKVLVKEFVSLMNYQCIKVHK